MSVQAMAAVLDYTPDGWEWTTSEKFVLVSIANHANKHGAESFPGWDTIAEETCLSPSTVARAIRTLRSHGVLSSRRSREGGRLGVTVYSIHLPGLTTPPVRVTDGLSPIVTGTPDVTTTGGLDVTVTGTPSVTPSVKPSVTDALRNQGTENPPAAVRNVETASLSKPDCEEGIHDFVSLGDFSVCRVDSCRLKITTGLAEMSA